MKKILISISIFIMVFIVSINTSFALEKSISDYDYGVSGKVTIPSIYEQMNINDEYKSLIIANDKGIDVHYKDNILHIDTIGEVKGLVVINDINKDNIKDIIYIVDKAEDFYNLIAVSGSDANIIWKSKVSEKVYNFSAGFIDQNALLYSLNLLGDKIAVIYNYDFVLYDIATGKESFHYTDKDNIWDITRISDINKDKIADYVISNQLGELKAFSGKTNKVLWSTLVTSKIKIYKDNDYKGKVSRNLWQVEYINDSLYTMGEDGTLYNINYKNGKIKNKVSIYEFDKELLYKYYNSKGYYTSGLMPISKNSFYYKMFEIIPLEDNQIIVTAFINRNKDASEENIEITYEKPFFALINPEDMSIKYKVSLTDLEINNTDIIDNGKEFIVAVKIKDEKLIFNSYDKNTGEEIKKYEIPIGSTFTSDIIKNIYLNKCDDKILLESKGNFSYIINNELNNIIKNNNSLSYSNVLSNSGKELVMYYKTNEIINKIVKYSDYTNNTKSFEYNCPIDFKNNGLTSINIKHDFNGDGIKDLTALINKTNDRNEVVASYFLILDMNNGNVISFKNIFLYSYKDENKIKIDVYLTGNDLYAVQDVNGDKKVDLVLDSNIIDAYKFKVIGSISESTNENGKTIKVGDINGDDFPDFINVLETYTSLYLSKERSNNVTYVKTNYKYSYDKALLNFDFVYKAPDINNDGINELIYNAKNEKGSQYYTIVSGRDLSIISNIERDGINEMMTFSFLGYDANNDGYNDIYETMNWQMSAKIVSGKTGEALISFPLVEQEGMIDIGKPIDGGSTNTIGFYETVSDKNVILGEDLTGDGNKELFILKETYYPKQEVTINAYDVFNKNSELIKKYTLKTIDNQEIYYKSYDVINEGDYFKRLIKLTDNLYVYKSTMNNKYTVYDVANEKEYSSFISSVDKVYLSDNKILGIYNNSPIVINYENDFKIKEKNEKGAFLNMLWDYNEQGGLNIIKIYDNNKYVKTSYKNSAKILLPEGKHTIMVESIDKWGKTSNYTFEVNIEKSIDALIITIVITIVCILLILYLIMVTKARRKKAVRRLP
jgi:hypothetical protein